ncbi:MAG: MFS transporter [Dehalococcoidia bacterium]
MDEPTPSTSPDAPARTALSGWGQTFEALRYRDFRLLWFSVMMIAGGVWLQQVTLGWLAFDMTHSPLQVGLIIGVRSAPLLLAPLAGVLADRFDRRKILLIDQTLVAVLVSLFAVDLYFEAQQVWHLYVFAVLFGLLWAVNNPVRQTLVANSVPREVLMNATALNSMAFNTMRTIGPAIGGFLIAFFGPAVNFFLQGALFFLVLGLLWQFRISYSTGDRGLARERSVGRNLVDGFIYVLHDKTVLTTTLITFTLALTTLSVVFTQLPVYAGVVLGDSEGDQLGLLLMAMGFGGLIGVTLLARFSQFKRKGAQSLVAFIGAAATIVVLSQVTTLWLAMAVLVVQQAFTQVVMTTNLTIVQTVTADEMRGRVTGVYQMEIGVMTIGGAAGGAIASAWGVDVALLVAGVLGGGIILLVALMVPRFRKLEL